MNGIDVLSFVAVALLLVMSPGPNGVLIAKTVPVSGKSAGFANIGGFIVAFYVHGCLSVLGISILLLQSAQAFFIFKMFGAAYLFWLGLKSILTAWKHDQPAIGLPPAKQRVSVKSAFLEGFLTNALNPKVSVFYLAAFPQFVSPSDDVSSAFTLVFLHSMLNLVWFSIMVEVLSRIKKFAVSPVFSRWLKSFAGAVFVGFAVKLALLKPLSRS